MQTNAFAAIACAEVLFAGSLKIFYEVPQAVLKEVR
jgi:hypothetical protein